jgi:beta-lactamase regulating signal transducer with metallopeptidase domain
MRLEALANIFAALLNAGIVSTLIVAALWLLLRITPRRALNAATRYAIWWIMLAIVISMPLRYLPHATSPAPVTTPTESISESSSETSEVSSVSYESAPATPIYEAPSSKWPRFPIEISGMKYSKWFAFAWVVISLAMLLRLTAAVIALRSRKARAFAAPVHIANRLQQWLATCGTSRRISLGSSAEISTPMAAGLRTPAILIPSQLFSELDAAEIDQIGLHETAHLARRDDYALIAQRMIEALFVLHPVVRWIARRIDLEREIACDDFVIAATGQARPYAACLTRVVELAGGVRGSLIAAAATEEPSHLARRVEMLLDKKRHTGTRLLKSRLIGAMIVLTGLVGVIASVPGVVAFAMPAEAALGSTDDQQPPLPPEPPQAPQAPTPRPRIPIAPLPPPAARVPDAPPAFPAPDSPVGPPTPAAPPAPETPLPASVPQAPVALPAPPAPLPFAVPPAPAAPRALTPRPPQANFAPAPAPFNPLAPPTPQAAPQAPTPPASAPPPPQGSFSSSVHSHNGDFNADWHWRDGLNTRDFRMQGHVEFNDDESDVKSIPPGGWFSYEESHALSSRKYQASADSSGNIKRQYLIDGRDHPFDDDARAWLRASLPDLLRESAIDAPERVRRIMKKGGANAVIAEIGKIHSSGARRRYIQELVPIGNLNTDQFQTLLRITRNIPSDGDKSSVLMFLASYTLKGNGSLRDYVFDAASTINSSGDRRRVLMNFIQQDPSPATLAASAKSAGHIPSDGDKSAVLIEVAHRFRSGDDETRRSFFRSLATVNSSGDRARVLTAVIGDSGSDRDTLVEALRSTTGIPSDGDKSRVLVHATGYWRDDDSTRRAFFAAANSVNSSGDHSRVLSNLAGHGGLSSATLVEVVHSSDRIPSDGDRAHVLLVVIARSDASNEALIAAVQSAARLNSEGEKARVLLAAIDRSSGKAAVRTEIRNAARAIHSDGEYRRVMSALDRQMAL